jgi:hypothetical protein
MSGPGDEAVLQVSAQGPAAPAPDNDEVASTR